MVHRDVASALTADKQSRLRQSGPRQVQQQHLLQSIDICVFEFWSVSKLGCGVEEDPI